MSRNEPVTRETLYEEVWAEPMTKVAERYKVSSSFLARVCTRLNVPRPPRGYWAKLAVGKAPKRLVLPEARPGDELAWSRDGEPVRVTRALPMPPAARSAKRVRSRAIHSDDHGILVGARGHFEAARENDYGYLKPQKKLLCDLIVSKNALNSGLITANALFWALEDRGHRVVIAPSTESFSRDSVDPREESRQRNYFPSLWSPFRPTVVYIGTVAIGLTIFELTKSVEVRWVNGKYIPVSELPEPKRRRYTQVSTWTHERDIPSGRLCLQAYSPYRGTEWKRQWRESKAGDLPRKFQEIARELEREAATIAKLVEEARKKAELEHQRWEAMQEKWRQEEAERRKAKAIKESREELTAIIEAWAEAKRIDDFFSDAEQRLTVLSDEDRAAILERLERAREFLGGIDALEWFKSWKAPEER